VPDGGDVGGAVVAGRGAGALPAGERDGAEGGGAEGGGDPADASPRAVGVDGEGGEQGLHVGEAVRRASTAEAAGDDAAQARGHPAIAGRRLGRTEHGQAQLGRGLAEEGPPPVEALVQADAEAELIALRVGGLAQVLLGRHVRRRPDVRADLRQRDLVAGADAGARRQELVDLAAVLRSGQAEVQHAHAAVVADQHVVGLEVAVDDAGRVRGGEALAGLQEHGEDLAPAAGPRRQPRAQALPATSSIARNTASPTSPTS
jgi:hypothetical protein